MQRHLAVLPLFILLFFSCQEKNNKPHYTLSEEDQRVNAFWTSFDFNNFNNGENTRDTEKLEQKFVDYVDLISRLPIKKADQAITMLLSKAKINDAAFHFFVMQYEKYLYHPNSPMRNERYYEPVLQYLIDSTNLESYLIDQHKAKLALIRRNQVGQKATDFNFLTASGQQQKLTDIDAPITILFFYEPGCTSCEESFKQLKIAAIDELIQKKQLAVLAIYATADPDIWKNYWTSIPSNWINGIDEKKNILAKDLYDLKASPTIYLLDYQKNVILKDISVEGVLKTLAQSI